MALGSAPLMFDLSAERCAKSVHDLSTKTRGEIESFLEATARASACVIVTRAPRPKREKFRRNRRRGDVR